MQIPTYKLPHTFILLLSFWLLILPTLSLLFFCISNKTTQHSFFFAFSTSKGENLTPSGQKLRGAGFGEPQSVISSNDSCHPAWAFPSDLHFSPAGKCVCFHAPHAVRYGLLPDARAPSRTHTRSQRLPPAEAKLNYMLSGEMLAWRGD